jgi:hypothetical protein
MPRIAFPSFAVDAPRGWADVTDSVEADDPPFTLNRVGGAGGVGSLQFSVGLYRGGPKPDPTPGQLLGMLDEFAGSRGLGRPGDVATERRPSLRLAAGSFSLDGNFLRVWYLSDGLSFALVTYTCAAGQEAEELADCERIVRSLVFAPR